MEGVNSYQYWREINLSPAAPISLIFSGYFEQCFAGKGLSWHQNLAKLFSFCNGKSSSLFAYLRLWSPPFCNPKPPLPEGFSHRWSFFSCQLPLIVLAFCPLYQTKQNLLWDFRNTSEFQIIQKFLPRYFINFL